MSNPQAISASRAMQLAQQIGARRKISIAGLSLNGVFLFATSILVIGSGFRFMRPQIMGLLLHPYLIPVALAFPFAVMARINLFPARVAAALLSFIGIYYFSILAGGGIVLGEVFKIAAGGVTIFTCALLVRRRGDFVAGVLGLAIAMAILAIRGLQGDTSHGVDALDAANKNTYSMFALPAILMSGFICLRMPTVRKWIKVVFILSTLAALAAIFMSANRSGYLGAALVALMLFWNRRGQGLVLVGCVTIALIFFISQFGSTRVFDQRMRQTVDGTKSDTYRITILRTCVEIGLSNPVIGVSPQKLPLEIGRRTQVEFGADVINSHNVFGHVLGGSGVFCSLALAALAWTLWFWAPKNRLAISRHGDPLYDARSLMRMMVFLWAVRGAFTNDILYNPSFNIAFGLCIGFCMLAEQAREMDLVGNAVKALSSTRFPRAGQSTP